MYINVKKKFKKTNIIYKYNFKKNSNKKILFF